MPKYRPNKNINIDQSAQCLISIFWTILAIINAEMSSSCPPKFLCILSSPSPYKQFNLCLRKAKKVYVADVIRASSDFLMKYFTYATSCLYPIWYVLVNFWSPDFPPESYEQNASFQLDLILTRMDSVLPCESCTSTFWSFLGVRLQHF